MKKLIIQGGLLFLGLMNCLAGNGIEGTIYLSASLVVYALS